MPRIVTLTSGRFGSYDPYAIDDANDKYPQHHCELNEDEFGRPYLGSYDRFLSPQWPYLLVVPSPLSFSAVPVLDQLFSAGAGGFQTLTQCITSNECNPNYGNRLYATGDLNYLYAVSLFFRKMLRQGNSVRQVRT